MKKICFLADSHILDTESMITGPAVQIHLLSHEFLKLGWDVHVISYHKSGRYDVQNDDGVKIHWIPIEKYFRLRALFRVWKKLKELNPGIVYQRGRDPLSGVGARFAVKKAKIFLWASSGDTGVERGALAQKKVFFKESTSSTGIYYL